MQVKLSNSEEQQGFIFKTTVYQLECIVKYSDEERDMLQNSGLLEHLVFEYAYPVGPALEYTIKDSLVPEGQKFSSKSTHELGKIGEKLQSGLGLLHGHLNKSLVELNSAAG